MLVLLALSTSLTLLALLAFVALLVPLALLAPLSEPVRDEAFGLDEARYWCDEAAAADAEAESEDELC